MMMNTLINSQFTLNAIDNPAALQGSDGRYIYCNPAFLAKVGKLSEEVLMHFDREIFNAVDALTHQWASKEMLSLPSKSIVYEIGREKSGSCKECTRSVSKSGVFLPNGSLAGCVSIYSIKKCQSPLTDIKQAFKLTNQEDCILKCLNTGLSIKSISKILVISSHTVGGT